MKTPEHRDGVFCPKDKPINHIWRKTNPPDLMRVHGIPHQNIFLPETVEQPLGVIGGDICSSACAYNHYSTSTRSCIVDWMFVCAWYFSIIVSEIENGISLIEYADPIL